MLLNPKQKATIKDIYEKLLDYIDQLNTIADELADLELSEEKQDERDEEESFIREAADFLDSADSSLSPILED